jgi:hypothetical protein
VDGKKRVRLEEDTMGFYVIRSPWESTTNVIPLVSTAKSTDKVKV